MRTFQKEIKATAKLARNLSSSLLTMIQFREECKDPVYRTEMMAFFSELKVLIPTLKAFYKEAK